MTVLHCIVVFLTVLVTTLGQKKTECQLRGKMRIEIGGPPDKSECLIQREGEVSGHFQCSSNELIDRKCMCNYHQFVASPDERRAYCPYKEDVDFNELTCQQCKNFSSSGPCGDRGSYICIKALASDITCNCKEGFTENYCDYKKVIMKCEQSDVDKSTCDIDNLIINCTTHSKVADLFFRCYSFYEDTSEVALRLNTCDSITTRKKITTEFIKYKAESVGCMAQTELNDVSIDGILLANGPYNDDGYQNMMLTYLPYSLVLLMVVFYSSGLLRADDICLLRGERKLQITGNWTEEHCTESQEGEVTGNYRCELGSKYIHVKRECMCNYQQLYTGVQKGYCPNNMDVRFKELRCADCKKYSVNGPCGDRGSYTCKPRTLALDINCTCNEGYFGQYCDYRKVTLSCRISTSLTTTCDKDNLRPPCVTRNAKGSLFFDCFSEASENEKGTKECKDIDKWFNSSTDRHGGGDPPYSTGSNASASAHLFAVLLSLVHVTTFV